MKAEDPSSCAFALATKEEREALRKRLSIGGFFMLCALAKAKFSRVCMPVVLSVGAVAVVVACRTCCCRGCRRCCCLLSYARLQHSQCCYFCFFLQLPLRYRSLLLSFLNLVRGLNSNYRLGHESGTASRHMHEKHTQSEIPRAAVGVRA